MTGQPKVRVALVGCGAVARLYYTPAIRQLAQAGDVELVMAFDPDRGAVEDVRKNFPGAGTVESFESLCTDAFDLAIVASPHPLHAPQTIALLQAGRSVLCEKPMAASLADAQAMLQAARSSDALLAVGMVRRFFPAAEFIRQALALGMLGEPSSFQIAEGGAHFGWPVTSVAYFQRRHSHGGVLMDVGSHVLDLVAWWLGEPDELEYQDDAMGGIEANCRIRVRYASGLSGEIRLSRDTALANRCAITGRNGWLTWSQNVADGLEMGISGTRYVLDAALYRTDATGSSGRARIRGYNFEQSFVAQLRNVVAAVRGQEPLRVPAEEAIPGMRLMDRCYRSRSLLPMAWLSAAEVGRALQLQRDPS